MSIRLDEAVHTYARLRLTSAYSESDSTVHKSSAGFVRFLRCNNESNFTGLPCNLWRFSPSKSRV